MKAIIPKINEEIRNSDYFKTDELRRRFGNKPANVVCLYLYNDINQIQNASPIIRTQWIDDSTIFRPMEWDANDIVEGIKIIWDRQNESFSSGIPQQRQSKGEYLSEITMIFDEFTNLFKSTESYFGMYSSKKIDYDHLIFELRAQKSAFDNMYFGMTNMGYPPYECDSLHKVLIDLVSMLHNVSVVANNEEYSEENVKHLINLYLNDLRENVQAYKYERSKVR